MSKPAALRAPMKRVVVIGGGTGNFVVLNGLRQYPVDLTAIVSMADDGGSTGILRDELGVLPPGDVRQCLIALSNSSRVMRSLMNYRFGPGGLGGHSFGNLFLSVLEKVTGSFEKAVEEVGKILSIKGKVVPVTNHQVRLRMILNNSKILEGEKEIYLSEEIDQGYKHIYLEPYPKASENAIHEIINADVIILGPGGLYTSLIPNLLVEGISQALRSSKAVKVFVVNLMNRKGQTTSYKVSDYVREISRFVGEDMFDYFIVNSGLPAPKLINAYAMEGELVQNDMVDDVRAKCADMLSSSLKEVGNGDTMKRSLIRHDSVKLAKELMGIVDRS